MPVQNVSPMPSVGGMRRSTRIFVPKSVVKDVKDDNLGKVLRSGKRLSLDSDEEKQGTPTKAEHLRLTRDSEEFAHGLLHYNTNGWGKVIQVRDVDVSEMDVNIVSKESVDNMSLPDELRYKKVYDRKRRRSKNSSKDPMHGTVYIRKKSRRTPASSSASGFSSIAETSGDNINFGGFGQESLEVSVAVSPSSSSHFTSFLLSILKFTWGSQGTLQGLAAFMCCEPIVNVFSQHGVHFNPGYSSSTSLAKDKISSGFCRIYGKQPFAPLFWLEFLAAPLAFRNLYYVVFFRSLYLPKKLSVFLDGLIHKTHDVLDEGKTLSSLPTENALPGSNSTSHEDSLVNQSNRNSVGVSGLEGGKVYTRLGVSRKIKKKRSSPRTKRVRNSFSMGCFGSPHFNTNGQTKININENKDQGSVGLDVVGSMNGGHNPLLSCRTIDQRQNFVQNDLCLNHKEVNSAIVGWRRKTDSPHCNANILVIESDKCYRVEGATVMMQCSNSKFWHVVVKVQGLTRYVHQAQEVMRPSTTNRFNHAVIWTSDNGWKLEFSDRKDWLVFKELHKECLSKNLVVQSSKTIPVPGVREVSNYDVGECVPFLRPDSYIVVHHNEVARALVKKTANYDIDPEDEEWLENLNTGTCNGEGRVLENLSSEKFEVMIDTLEKAAYRNPVDVSDVNRMTSFVSDFGSGDMIAAVYEYWLRKRKQKHAALLRVFEAQPPRRAQAVQENVLRKKRSFKKQVSQNGRGKPSQYYIEGMFSEDVEAAKKRVDEAQRKAEAAHIAAVEKRKRAQKLMGNADLAAYLAAMSVKIAETVQLAESPSDAAEWLSAG